MAQSKDERTYKLRQLKVTEQASSYARFLAQEAMSDVVAYIFDDTDGLVNLEEFGTFRYLAVKDDQVRGRLQGARWGS